jgi:hypothetical protein
MLWIGKKKSRANGAVRAIAFFAAGLVLSAQLLAGAHYHRDALTDRVNARATYTVDGGLCPVCLLAFHLPLNPPASPAIARPEPRVQAAPRYSYHASWSFNLSLPLTRAPPQAL